MRKIIAIVLSAIMLIPLGVSVFAVDNPFVDVKESDWFYSDVMKVYEAGYMAGTDATHFSPDDSLTRAMIVTVLWSIEGSPTGYTCSFSDVKPSKWYYKAVAWAQSNGIVSGVGDGKYAPDQTLTREQMATIVYRYAQNKLNAQKTDFDYSGYSDASSISKFAREGVSWLMAQGALHCENNMIKPKDPAKRAEVASGAVLFIEGVDPQPGGSNGKSAYEIAVEHGFEGTEEEWLESLVGAEGKSAYEIAVSNGFTGTESEWLESLIGAAGSNGVDGKSAYDLAVENGYSGTMAEWLASLIGAAGQDGQDGANGKSAYELAVENGYTGTLQEWLASLAGTNGKDGKDGKDGVDGKSAYEVAVANGYTGTENEWLESLVGAAGKDGTNGIDGKDGTDGKSAYEIAVDNGYTGTAQEWLASLAGTNGKDGINGKSAFEIAVANGYTGTEVEWLRSLAGKDGKSAYELAVDHGYTGTEVEWLASLVGEAGSAGKDGANGKSAYELAVANGYTGTMTEWLASLIGPTGAAGKDGMDGTNGVNGVDGKSAYELAVELGYNGDLASWLDSLRGSNGTNGKDGKDGANGASAYELAVANGYTGTLTEWLVSLVGAPGKDGTNGKSAYELAVENGFTGTVQEWLVSLAGVPGRDGIDGKDGTNGQNGTNGKSAFELAVENGYLGTVQEWLASLVGAPGKDGTNGTNGTDGRDGADGKSAYEIAVANGYTGTEQEWLASLAGTNGKDGKDGKDGTNGNDGKDGTSVANAYVNDQLHLILVLSDGTEIDAGYVGVSTGSNPEVIYTVTFKDYNGTVLKTQQVEAGGNATPPADPAREGYTFTGWSGNYTNVQSDVTVIATYTQNPAPVVFYTVTFKDYNGTVLKTQQVEAGGSATPPADPSREGYTFTGWSGSYTNVHANTTVTATYVQNSATTYTVTFYDYDGTTVLATRTGIPAGGNAVPPAEPTRLQYVFAGWNGVYTDVHADQSVLATYLPSFTQNILKVSSASGEYGDTVTVTLEITGTNVLFGGCDLMLSFDENALTFVNKTDSGAASSNYVPGEGLMVSVMSSTGMNMNNPQVFSTITFTVNSNSAGKTPLLILVDSMFDENDDDISYVVINGEVVMN